MLRLPIAAAVALLAISSAPQPRTIIVAQPNAPIEITKYDAKFQRRGSYTTEGISHSLEYRNRGAQKVQAIRFGLVSFDVFNDFLDRTGGVAMEDIEPGRANRGSWVATAYADFAFLTGVAYVSMVRLEDGTIWKADPDVVLAELKKIEKDFDAKQLEEKKGSERP